MRERNGAVRRKGGLRDRFRRAFRWLRHPESPLPILAALLGAAIWFAILVILYFAVPNLIQNYWPGVFVEATGFLFDLIIFGVVLALILRWQERKHAAARNQEEIQDFKRWDTDEGRMRIAGCIRRLVGMGVTDIDFVGIKLSNFSLKVNDIRSIRGSKFYEGEWGALSSREEVELTKVDFSFVNCSDVVFSVFNPLDGLGLAPPVKLLNCSFQNADLSRAQFNGAALEWSAVPPEEIFEFDELSDGTPVAIPIFRPPFEQANLAGAAFRGAHFKNADFREALNVTAADFTDATGVETCFFDDEATAAAVLQQSAKYPRGLAALSKAESKQ